MISGRERLVEPDYLCFVNSYGVVQCDKVANAPQAENGERKSDYVFVSWYSGQFSDGKASVEYLKYVGIDAAQHSKVGAYWISTSCLYDLNEKDDHEITRQKEQTVWNMSDIIRRARTIAIAVSGPPDSSFIERLKEWGRRFWTMPELLLYSGTAPILVYDQRLNKRHSFPRQELWDKVWSDTDLSGQLIDHYEGSLILTPLELSTVALHCLQNRYTSGEYLKGDLAYGLMGLLRRRPEIVRTDSEFQAFARLSLANDSNMLLERMICLLSTDLDSEWWSLDDAWNVALWDIYPKTQVCGLGSGDTVILDGARGAAIRWDKFVPVTTLGEETMRHCLIRYFVRTMPGMFVMGLLWTVISAASKKKTTPVIAMGGALLGISSLVVIFLPYLLRMIYSTKTYHSQPFFFGFEGHLDIYDLELLIFGSYEGRLGWSTTSSPLSRHGVDKINMNEYSKLDTMVKGFEKEQEFCRGLDPKHSDEVAKLVGGEQRSSHQGENLFTLVDTYTMTVTLFEAVRPPIAVVVCGAEGGMQRALLCSEDWTTSTLYRETVLRMETRVWDKMDTLARIRLGLKREDTKEALTGSRHFAVNIGS